MSTDLTNPHAQDAQVGAVIPGFGYSGAMSPDDVQLPRIVLTQMQTKGVSEGEIPPGVYYDTLMGDVIGTAFDFVPVVYYTNRVLLEMGVGLKCRSLDMEHGIGDPGGDCEACPLKDWPARGAKKKGPDCNVSRNYLGVIVGASAYQPGAKKDQTVSAVEPIDPRIAILQWRSMATGAAKTLNGIHMQSSLLNVNAREWEHRVYRIGAMLMKNDLGSFYIPTVKHQGMSRAEHRETATFVKGAIVGRDFVRETVEGQAADPAAEF
jgi:hypothetical protein